VRVAYADPPYVGQARKHYGADAKEVNHALLIAHLTTFDAWALSLSTPSLREILALCPADVRVGGWFKPFASFKPGVNPGYCWEPVIFHGGRSLGRDVPTVRDYCVANITLKRGLSGAKPDAFCYWLFAFLGMEPSDDFADLFPGSGAVSRAWSKWCAQSSLRFGGAA
jgi:hypothetical protein